jgi:hypothetical protein
MPAPMSFAAPPEYPADVDWHEAEVPSRFEDITQDGRLQLGSLLPGLGATTWRHLLTHPDSKRLLAGGVVPILSRLVIEGGVGPFSPAHPLAARGAFAFSHTTNAAGSIERLLLSMWLEVRAPIGRTYGAPPDDAGTPVLAGRVYAEHTITRPFASSAEERRVSLADLAGVEGVPGQRVEAVAPASLETLPERAVSLDEAPRTDAAAIHFGLSHTDSNQHVNSLVYLRLFEEAALRRLAEHGVRGARIAKRVHVAYRKPCFASDAVRIELRAYEHEGRHGAVGSFVPEGGGRPYCHVALSFD